MTKQGIHDLVEAEATVLGPLLYEGLASSMAAATVRVKGLSYDKYPHLMPLVLRAEMREFLESNPVPHEWCVAGDSRQMGQLLLARRGMELRFLKERRRTYPGGVPIAGSNRARRERWVNEPLDLALPAIRPLTDEGIHLLLLWDFLAPNAQDGFRLRIVHTLAPGVHGRPVPCDLIVDVNDGGSIFSHLSFPGSPDEDDFFLVEIEEEDGSGA